MSEKIVVGRKKLFPIQVDFPDALAFSIFIFVDYFFRVNIYELLIVDFMTSLHFSLWMSAAFRSTENAIFSSNNVAVENFPR